MSNSERTIPNTSGAAKEAVTIAAESCPVRAAYDAAAQALHEALARKTALTERAATMTRARDAAQAEANAARQQWSGLLREADGTLTRDIQKLRAAEASALTLVEEYGVMHQEIGMQVTGMEVSVAELAEVAIGKREAVIELASREAFAKMVEKVGDAVASAFVLYKRGAAVTPGGMMASDSEVRAAFLDQLGREVDKRVALITCPISVPPDVQDLDLNGADMSLVLSPVKRARLRQQLCTYKPSLK
ncbi:hypothetical protein [Xanthomonas oryzae]|uniref:hypothetical protein n=1 Tax=Xanthomonas oryzae TaxID=347 RepID=UPI000949F5F6|nr:hypothetical protein [Xanthomonas oryzae]MEC5112882.1 hypothetical protein [Xanthomonas oryzae pv. oryzicola]QIE17585.1 hypothetical protein IXO1088_023440 [Xanthomonas oryzae pv. oryzae]UXV99322.1 hypothetical protein IXO1104_22265 [Xanthomonas oryzae pv. oryzae]UZK16608.1 hypothetical protein DXO174_021765 [Xanthomonas oryzae pv. oryzae]UZK20371.1 hypothetical protein DXO233_21950 [Xanthomonas oryzae pv. oryzae]